VGLTYEDQIWNRACVVDLPDEVGVGDRHLWSLLRVDGVVMSGGVGFAVDVLDAEAFAHAVIASRYFGAGLRQPGRRRRITAGPLCASSRHTPR
jgi:hypothetical protein